MEVRTPAHGVRTSTVRSGSADAAPVGAVMPKADSSSSVSRRERMRNRTPSGASTEKPLPRPLHDVDGEVGVLPVLVLRHRHPERRSGARGPSTTRSAEVHVGLARHELTGREAHGRAAVAAAAGLVEHQRTVDPGEAAEQVRRLTGEVDPAGGSRWLAGCDRLGGAVATGPAVRRSRARRASRRRAGSSSAGSGRASSCGSRGRCPTACSHRTRRAPGTGGSSSSRRDRP